MGKQQFLLFDSASGFALFELVEVEEVALLHKTVQDSINDLGRLGKIVKLKAFNPFSSAENALTNINSISESAVTDDLKNFLEANLPKVKEGKKAKFVVGVIEPKIGSAIQEACSVPCNTNETIAELMRGIRLHFPSFVKGLEGGNLERAQLGLSHSYSRAKVKFNVNRSDNMIIQAISLLDQLDKDLNTNAMRFKEWYGWHFPELTKLVKDSYLYARVAEYIGTRDKLSDERIDGLTELTLDEDLSKSILEAARTSMGMDMAEVDMVNLSAFTSRLVSLGTYRKTLMKYLEDKMGVVAPNLGAVVGETVGARLISHAGSLTNLAKAPASTVQILGAEKALFRALKTKGNTPKYGLIFHSSFIGRAAAKNKGRISRFLANKCSIASRLDAFSDTVNSKYGEALREQVEERLKFFETGDAPRRNADVMAGVARDLALDDDEDDDEDVEVGGAGAGAGTGGESSKKDKKAKKKKDKKVAKEAEAAPAPAAKDEKKKKKKKDKKRERDEPAAEAAPAPAAEEAPKKKKKKKEKKSKKE